MKKRTHRLSYSIFILPCIIFSLPFVFFRFLAFTLRYLLHLLPIIAGLQDKVSEFRIEKRLLICVDIVSTLLQSKPASPP